MRISFRRFDLKLAHRWAIARSVRPGGSGGTEVCQVVFAELTDKHGNTGLGEAAPSSRYEESADSALAFLEQVEPRRLSFSDVPGSMNYLDGIAPKNFAAKCSVNIALLDGAARRAGKPIYDHLGLGFTENKHVKLVKTGGISAAFEALQAARKAGLKTMIGCMIESSVLITAGAHLAELADYLDIDGNLLVTNDPYLGATAEHGVISFARTPKKTGLRVTAR